MTIDVRRRGLAHSTAMLAGRQRILILGSGGAGKSTFAKRLGAIIGVPVIHLDRHFWQPGWKQPPEDEWFEKVRGLAAGERWIMEGNFSRSLHLRAPRADAIVFLDYSRLVCLSSAIGRWLRQRGQVREDMAPGCPECFDPAFLKWIVLFPHRSRKEVLRVVEGAGSTVERIILRNRPESHRLLAAVEAAAPSAGR